MVWGKRMNALAPFNEESMFVKFNFRTVEPHFLEDSKEMYLTLRGYERNIRLVFSTDFMK